MCQICTLALQAASRSRKQDLQLLNPTLSKLITLNPSPQKKAELSSKIPLSKT